MGPKFAISDIEKSIVLELCQKADDIALGNLSFDVYNRSIKFEMILDEEGWNLYVRDLDFKQDIYRIINGELIYKYSE